MGYIINPAEVRNWIWEVKSWLYEMEERYQSAFAIIKEFAENEGLEGNSYDKMKADFMIYHQLSVHGAGEVRGSIDRDLFILEGTIGEENLDEELLLEQIENQKAICRKCEDIIDNLTSLSRVPFMEYFLESLIEKYRILLAKAEGLLEDLEEKLERIYEINDNTARLFITAADWLSAISSAIRDLQVCVTGKGNVSDGSWKDLLMPSFEEKVGKLEVFEGGSEGIEGTGNVPSDVLSLMNASIDSTWCISDSTAEAWFLSTNTVVIKKYGLNSTNIGEVTAAIKAASVSPIFFYAYVVNEGGGAGGFINHYGKNYYANNGGDTAVNAASGDAKYLASQSAKMNSSPAWIDAGNPVDFVPLSVKDSGNASFASMPSGSIGRAYIPATAAATWEVYYPEGLLKSYNQVQNYGAPMKGVLSFIVAMSEY